MTTITENTYTTIIATSDDDWIISGGVTVSVSGLGINASGAVQGRDFTINGSLLSGNQPAIRLGDASEPDIQTIFKVGDIGLVRSGNAGLVALSGGVTFQNAGQFEAALVAIDLVTGGNSVKNDNSITSTGSIAIRTSGLGDTIENNGTITSYADAIVSSGADTSIANNTTLVSRQGRAVYSTGDGVEIANNAGQIRARLDAITAAGADAVINNYAVVVSKKGAGIVSTGDGASLSTTADLRAATFGILSTGGGAAIGNTASLKSDGTGIKSTGDDAVITSTGYLFGKTTGILSTGDNADITNTATIESRGIGIKSTGDHANIYTSLTLIGKTALLIAGNDTEATNANNIYGTSKSAAAVRITSDEGAAFTNNGKISTASGHAIEAGNGADSIVNTGTIKGDVSLGGGNDWFSSLSGKVTGTVYGGKGDDVYETGIKLHIVEKANEGYDTVRSAFSWTLGANIENLVLTGSENAFGKGNRLDNVITANAGDNTLTGGAGRDTFVFVSGGHDTITDFQDHKDLIDFSNLPGVDSWADIEGHMSKVGKDVLIDLTSLEADLYLTVKNITLAKLTEADFIFQTQV